VAFSFASISARLKSPATATTRFAGSASRLWSAAEVGARDAVDRRLGRERLIQ